MKRIFLSAVSKEFRSYRELLANDLRRASVEVKVQEDFGNLGRTTLHKLDVYIQQCAAVIHLIGDMTGSAPETAALDELLAAHPDLLDKISPLKSLSRAELERVTYTQWEAYLGVYYGLRVCIYRPAPGARRDSEYVFDIAQQKQQERHHERICALGRDRDQFLNQERLSSFVLADLNDILPPHDVTIAKASSKLEHQARKLIGREPDLARLDDAWAKESCNVVVIRAWGGVGKTALVASWMADLARKGWRGALRYFDWSFYSQGVRTDAERGDKGASADLFIAKALEFFGDPDPQKAGPWERGQRLAGLVAKERTLLILDGLEPLQHPPGPQHGELIDDALRALLRGLCEHNPGLCLVTTREYLPDIQHHYDKTAQDWHLEHLSDEAGAALLYDHGVRRAGHAHVQPNDAELQAASKEVRGHALTLQLMGQYLHLAHGGDIRQRDRFGFAEADAEIMGGHAFRVLAAYENWLQPRELAVLRLMGLFDRPADPGCLKALRSKPVIAGLTDAVVGLSDAQWNIAVSRLAELKLVQPQPYERTVAKGYNEKQGREALARDRRGYRMNLPEPTEFQPPAHVRFPAGASALEAHPLVRQYFAQKLREATPEAWREGHRRLYAHLKESVPFWPEGLAGLQPLYQAVAHGCQAGLQPEAREEVYRDRILRGTGDEGFYSSKKLGAIGADLGAVACFFTTPLSVPAANLAAGAQAWLLSVAAYCLRALGRLTDALEPMRAGLQMRIDQQNWKQAAICAGNLSELELALGDIAGALADAARSVDFADRSKDEFQRMSKRTTHADALHQAGRAAESRQVFAEAEKMQAERQPEYPQLYSLQGFQYCDLLLADAERAAWRALLLRRRDPAALGVCGPVTSRALEMLQGDIDARLDLLSIALDSLLVARSVLVGAVLCGRDSPAWQGEFGNASSPLRAHLAAAVSGLRAANSMHHVPRGLLTLAWVRFLEGDSASCKSALAEARQIAERGPMPLHLADIALTTARLFHDKTALAEARRLIAKHGYHRRDAELQDAEEAAKSWP